MSEQVNKGLFLNDPAIRFMGLSREQQEWINKVWPLSTTEPTRERSMLFPRTMENLKMLESIAHILKGFPSVYYSGDYIQFKLYSNGSNSN